MSEKYTLIPNGDVKAYVSEKARIVRQARKNFRESWATQKVSSNAPLELVVQEPVKLQEVVERKPSKIIETKYFERKESLPAGSGLVLAGIFEAGGYMGIGTKNEQNRQYARRPAIKVRDNKLKNMRNIAEHFGGRLAIYDNSGTHDWTVKGQDAIDLARLMEPWVVRRRDTVDAFLSYENASSEERLALACDLLKHPASSPTKEDYLPLVEHGEFLAGVYEARGSVDKLSPDGKSAHRIRLSSKNRSLIEAIGSQYGVNPHLDERTHSFSIGLSRHISKDFIEKVTPHLINPLISNEAKAA